jgi:hypothetical protein
LAKAQLNPVSPPQPADAELLNDFAAILQRNLEELYQDAHTHDFLSTDPSTSDGAVGDIQLVDDGTNKYLVIRYSDGWYKTANLTAI